MAVATPGGRGVGAGFVTSTSVLLEFDDKVTSMGVFEAFIIETERVPESPANIVTVQVKEKAVVVHTPVGDIAADVTDRGSAILSVDIPTMGENESAAIGIKVKSIPAIPIRRLVSCFLISMLDDRFATI